MTSSAEVPGTTPGPPVGRRGGSVTAFGRHAWRGYAVVAVAAAASYFVVPPLGKWLVWVFFAVTTALCVAIGMVQHRPPRLAPWLFILANQALYGAANTIFFHRGLLGGGNAPLASAADLMYLATSPLLFVALLILVRRSSGGRDRTALLDALIVATAAAVAVLALVIDPEIHAAAQGLRTRLVAVGYPVGDLLVLIMWARIWAVTRVRSAAFGFLTLSLVPILVGDLVYTYLQLHGRWHAGTAIDLSWMVFQGAFAVFALHPAMRNLGTPVARAQSDSRQRLGAMLAFTMLVPAAVLTVEVKSHDAIDVGVIVGGSVVLFALTAVRVGRVVAEQRRALASYEESVGRENVLREIGTALVASTDRAHIYAAAIDGMRELTGDAPGASRRVVVGTGGETICVGSCDGIDGASIPLDALAAAGRASVDGYVTVSLVGRPDLRRAVFAPEQATEAILVPVPSTVQTHVALVATSAGHLRHGVRDAFVSLATQTGLALQRAALAEDALRRRSEHRLEVLLRHVSEIICVIDEDLVIRYQSPSGERVFGSGCGVGTTLIDSVHREDAVWLVTYLTELHGRVDDEVHRVELRRRVVDGELRHFECVVRWVEDEDLRGYVLTSRDITERKALEDQLRHQAFHDGLTGLPNRALFHERVERAVERAKRTGQYAGVLLCDLDDFKTVNDSLGHAAGDALLEAVGARMAAALRSHDTVARLGGDEFAVVVEDVRDEEAVNMVADRLLEGVRRPFVLGDTTVTVRVSVGVAIGDGTADPAELLRNADMAMYLAKRDGKDRAAKFESGMHADMLERLALTTDLTAAVEHNEFVVHYQPIVELAQGDVVGFEALVRWQHPRRGLLYPNDFIPLAEETGLIVPIGASVLRQALQQLATWQLRWPARPLMMSVNLSARQLQDPDLLDDVRRALAESGVDPADCTLEITESLLMQDTDGTLERLTELKRLGVRLAIDDFGTGYSSLAYLRRFPVDRLKVAREFVDGVNGDAQALGLVETILTLAATLGLEPIAEGIEDAGQREQLTRLGCPFGQGYHFARPADAHVVQQLVDDLIDAGAAGAEQVVA